MMASLINQSSVGFSLRVGHGSDHSHTAFAILIAAVLVTKAAPKGQRLATPQATTFTVSVLFAHCDVDCPLVIDRRQYVEIHVS